MANLQSGQGPLEASCVCQRLNARLDLHHGDSGVQDEPDSAIGRVGTVGRRNTLT